jgi:CheY-like chemotaxis protein
MLGNEPKNDMRPASIQKTEEMQVAHDEGTTATARLDSGRPRVLVVEDNPDNMVTVKAIIQEHYSVIEACDGEQGLTCALEELPDIILLDASLPKMDGIEVVRILKKHVKTRRIPVIAVTARAMKKDREMYLAAGFDDYVTKPIDHELLLGVLKKWL